MELVSLDDPISGLKITKRYENALKKSGIHTVEDLVETSGGELETIENLGKKGLAEVEDTLSRLEPRSGRTYQLLPGEVQVYYQRSNTFWIDGQGKFFYDVSLDHVPLSQRSVNSLKKYGLKYASELYYLMDVDFATMDNLGSKSIMEIKKCYDEVPFEAYEGSVEDRVSVLQWAHRFVEEVGKKIPVSKYKLRKELFLIADNYMSMNVMYKIETSVVSNREFLHSLDIICYYMEEMILDFVANSPNPVTEDMIVGEFPKNFVDSYCVSKYLRHLEGKRAVTKTEEGFWESENISVVDYVDMVDDDRKAFVLRERIAGKTLEEIALQLDLTRERVRQIILKLWKKAPPLQENKLRVLFQRYQLSQEEFCTVFQEEPSTYYYLSSRYDRGSLSLEDVEEDETLEEHHRINARKILYKNYVFLQGQPVLRDRDNLMKYALKTIGENDNTMEELEKYYGKILDGLGIEDKADYSYSRQALMNKISSSCHALWKYGKKFRYYNIESYDFEDFFEELDLEQYEDVEFSTLKLFRSHPEVMEEFNILDEYELHNLLKKLDVEEKFPGMMINRMPLISFGEANRETQVMALLRDLAPITISEFARAYEEEYGVLRKTVAANFLNNVSDYLNDLNHNICTRPLSPEGEAFLREILVEDFYSFEVVRDRYLAEFPLGDPDEINIRSMRDMGFKTYNTYMIRNTYSSAADYFRFRVLTDELWDLREIRKDIRKVMSFESELYKAKENYDILEYEPKKFMNIAHLKDVSIGKKDLVKYCKAVAEYVDKDQYFTVYSLRKQGFYHSLYQLGYDDYFYASLLATYKKSFSNQRMGHGKVFTKGKNRVYSTEFLHWVVTTQVEGQEISLMQLQEVLKKRYDLMVDHYKLLQVVHESELYYDGITGKVFGSYEIYATNYEEGSSGGLDSEHSL